MSPDELLWQPCRPLEVHRKASAVDERANVVRWILSLDSTGRIFFLLVLGTDTQASALLPGTTGYWCWCEKSSAMKHSLKLRLL